MLGGQSTQYSNVTNVNDYTKPGHYLLDIEAGATSSPDSSTAMTVALRVEYANGNRLIQTLTWFNQNETYQRLRKNDTGWTSWTRLDNFGCRTLAELKAALANV